MTEFFKILSCTLKVLYSFLISKYFGIVTIRLVTCCFIYTIYTHTNVLIFVILTMFVLEHQPSRLVLVCEFSGISNYKVNPREV